MGDLLEELEMLVGAVGSHVGELGLGLGNFVDGEGDVERQREKDSGRGGRMG